MSWYQAWGEFEVSARVVITWREDIESNKNIFIMKISLFQSIFRILSNVIHQFAGLVVNYGISNTIVLEIP